MQSTKQIEAVKRAAALHNRPPRLNETNLGYSCMGKVAYAGCGTWKAARRGEADWPKTANLQIQRV